MIIWWSVVLTCNICYSFSDFVKNFESYSHGDVDTLDIPYDYNSLMHYENLAFSKNRHNTIEALDDSSRQLGQLDSFSATDIKQLLKVYKCRSIDKDPLPAQPLRSKTSEREESEDNRKATVTKRHLGNFMFSCSKSFRFLLLNNDAQYSPFIARRTRFFFPFLEQFSYDY